MNPETFACVLNIAFALALPLVTYLMLKGIDE